MLATRILRKSWEVEPELIRRDLTLEGLLRVRTMALAAGADATPFHAANAAGSLTFHYGIYGLRDEFVGDEWRLDRPNGVEVIRNDRLNMLVSFANVDVACNDFHDPKPRSKKGAGTERTSQTTLFESLPTYAPTPGSGHSLYYLMVGENGNSELSRPVVKNGSFGAYIERLYLSIGDDGGGIKRLNDDSDIADNFDPLVLRKIR